MLPWCQSVTSALTSGTLQQQKEMAHNLWLTNILIEREMRGFLESTVAHRKYTAVRISSAVFIYPGKTD